MTDNTPRERDITRVQLWERIDASYVSMNKMIGEVYGQIDNIKQFIAGEMTDIMGENKKILEVYKMKINDEYQKAKKELQKDITSHVQEISKIQNDFSKEIDNKINAINVNIYAKVEDAVQERLMGFKETEKTVLDKTALIEKYVKKETGKFQVDITDKFGLLNKKLDSVMKKFRMISDGLS